MSTAYLIHLQQQFVGFLMVFCRVASMLLTAPVFGSTQLPAQVKAAIALILSAVVFSGLGFPAVTAMKEPWVSAVAGELAMGLGIGLIGTLLVGAVQMGGQLIGLQMGFGIVNVIDPMSSVSIDLLGQFKFFVAILVFLVIDGHHEILRAIHGSFALIPPGQVTTRAAMGSFFIEAGSSLFSNAFRVAAPVITSLLVVTVGFAIISRTVPQINFMIVGFAFKIVMGLFVMWLGIEAYTVVMQNEFNDLPRQFMGFIKLFAP